MGHREPERPHDDNPYIKLDGPTRRLFSDSELEPLAAMLRHSLANEVVNRYVNEALRALPEHWIRKAGVYLPELGSPLRYLAVGPTGAFIITPTNGRWTRDGLLELERAARAWTGCFRHTTSRRPGSGWCSRPTIRHSGRRCLASRARAGSG